MPIIECFYKDFTVDRVSMRYLPQFGTAKINFHFMDDEEEEVFSIKMDLSDLKTLIEYLNELDNQIHNKL
jgi:translation elongation factor P/translation initiation factor 5A